MTSVPLIDTKCTTLTKFIFAEEIKHYQATGEFTELLNSLQIIAKTISAMVRKAGLTQLFGLTDKSKESKKIQALADEIFVNILSSSGAVGILISQESKNVIEIDKDKKGKYIVAFDSLDGLSNVDCAVTIGSIFGIWCKEIDSVPTAEDAIDPTNKFVAAGYVVYGSATVMVLSTGEGVNGFVLDPQIGEFLLSDRHMTVPKKGNIYSINEGYAGTWNDALKEFISEKKFPNHGKPYTARYVGSMVADIHRTLKHGGIFLYPATQNDHNGKLRLLYECKPMAFILTQAGGLATDGKTPILDIEQKEVHQKSPFFAGSKEDVEELIQMISKHQVVTK